MASRLERGDLMEYECYNDDAEALGSACGHVLGTGWDEIGFWVKLHVIAVESDYNSWWINEDTNPAWYHMCAGSDHTSCKVCGGKEYGHIDHWRIVSIQDVLDPGLSWAQKGPAR